MPIQHLDRHRRVIIMGLGLFGGGVGATRFWCDLGANVTVTDLRDADILAPSLAQLTDCDCQLVLGEHREEDFKQADVVVVNPAVQPDNKFLRLARACGADILTEIGLVFRIARSNILAVTGSNGKSTTTALLGAMLQRHDPDTLLGGNIGGSLLPDLRTHLPSAPLVLELSSFQLHYLKHQHIAPDVAVVTNLSPNHLDWHHTLLQYYEDKRNILRFQRPEQWAVLNFEDDVLRAWSEDASARVLRVARDDPGGEAACFLRGASDPAIVCRIDKTETELAVLSDLRLPGAHNSMNALQAAAAAFVHTGNCAAIRDGLRSFTGLPHRLEEVGAVGGKRFINDSIATTPESSIAALQSYKQPKVLIAGGYDKGVSFDELGMAILQYAYAAVLIGDTATAIRESVEKALDTLEHDPAAVPVGGKTAAECEPLLIDAGPDFDSAVRVAGEICPDGGVVLLSPACASYGMFKNFEERGDIFRTLVQRMIHV